MTNLDIITWQRRSFSSFDLNKAQLTSQSVVRGRRAGRPGEAAVRYETRAASHFPRDWQSGLVRFGRLWGTLRRWPTRRQRERTRKTEESGPDRVLR